MSDRVTEVKRYFGKFGFMASEVLRIAPAALLSTGMRAWGPYEVYRTRATGL